MTKTDITDKELQDIYSNIHQKALNRARAYARSKVRYERIAKRLENF